MAPSTTSPIIRIRANIVIMLSENPETHMNKKPTKSEKGMAIAIRIELRNPINIMRVKRTKSKP